jgi:hypothetical protein
MAEQPVVATQPVEAHNKRKVKQQREGFSGIFEVGVGEHRLEIGVKRGPIRPESLRLSHSYVGAQLTSHMGKLKVSKLCLAAFAAAFAIDGNARRSSAG